MGTDSNLSDWIKKGEYYLDFSRYFDANVASGLSAGSWFIDVETMQLKVSGLSEEIASFYENSTPGVMIAYCLEQVEIDWIPVAKSKEEAKQGGWFFDRDKAIETSYQYFKLDDPEEYSPDEKQETEKELVELIDDFLARYQLYVNPGDKLLRYQVKATIAGSNQYREMRLPVYQAMNPLNVEELAHFVILEAAVQQGENPKPKTGSTRFIELLMEFFRPFFDFFKRLFGQ